MVESPDPIDAVIEEFESNELPPGSLSESQKDTDSSQTATDKEVDSSLGNDFSENLEQFESDEAEKHATSDDLSQLTKWNAELQSANVLEKKDSHYISDEYTKLKTGQKQYLMEGNVNPKF